MFVDIRQSCSVVCSNHNLAALEHCSPVVQSQNCRLELQTINMGLQARYPKSENPTYGLPTLSRGVLKYRKIRVKRPDRDSRDEKG